MPQRSRLFIYTDRISTLLPLRLVRQSQVDNPRAYLWLITEIPGSRTYWAEKTRQISLLGFTQLVMDYPTSRDTLAYSIEYSFLSRFSKKHKIVNYGKGLDTTREIRTIAMLTNVSINLRLRRLLGHDSTLKIVSQKTQQLRNFFEMSLFYSLVRLYK